MTCVFSPGAAWPRSKIAALIETLSRNGARVVGIDIGFLEPDENSEIRLMDRLAQNIKDLGIRNEGLERFVSQNRREADNDLILARAIENVDADVVLGYFFYMSADDLNFELTPEQIEGQLARIEWAKYPLVIFEDPDMTTFPFLQAYAPQANLKILSEATDSAGYFNMTPDADGVVRWTPLIVNCGDNLYPPLSIQCLWNYLDRPMMLVKIASHGIEGIQVGERFIPTDERGMMLINYVGPSGTFPHYSITDILNGRVPADAFRDKIVLIGPTATGIYDVRNTPFSPVFPGVEVHATLIDNMLKQNFLSKPKWAILYDLLAIALLGVIIGLVLPRVSPLKGLLFGTLLFAAHIMTTGYLFEHAGVWLNMTYPLMALILNYVALTVYDYFTEEKEKKMIRGTFNQYVSKDVIDVMLQDPDKLKLGGEEKVLSILFSGIIGFSEYSEKFSPKETIDFLGEYFDEMTAQIFAAGGTLKAYMGDEIMAIFGAPLEQPDHAARACRAALAMRDRLRELRETWSAQGRPPFKIRLAVNSGPVLLGNLGSDYRFSYDVIGDHVNLSSRLEGIAGMYDVRVVVSEYTFDMVKNDFVFRYMDTVGVKGRKQPVAVHELVAEDQESLPEKLAAALRAYDQGLQCFFQRKWQEAIERFKAVINLNPDDGPSRVMMARCLTFLDEPPADDWDGVTRFTKKR
ncbi:MAG: adenylate/guanylate cyclase domain-containing protein [Deltaproteobacteria bacterium]|nr:adenylate/guanylate cyclase domain-containing protein [Deltaproteobacteria bacterium]